MRLPLCQTQLLKAKNCSGCQPSVFISQHMGISSLSQDITRLKLFFSNPDLVIKLPLSISEVSNISLAIKARLGISICAVRLPLLTSTILRLFSRS